MGHHHHHHSEDHLTTKNITFAFWQNTSLAVFEIIGGFYINSVAVMSNGLHDFGDSLSLGLSWYFQNKSNQKRDDTFSYGYKRFSLLGAFINALILLIGSIFVIQESIGRLLDPVQPNANGMIVFAVVGIIANTVAMLRLRQGGSLNERVISLHFLEDVLGWMAVLIGSIVMMFVEIPVLDAVLSILIAAFILFNVYKNLKSVFKILLQAVPENINEDEIREKVLSIHGVLDVHDVRAWTMDGSYNVLTLHVVIKPDTALKEIEDLKKEVRHCLKHLTFNHITLEIESSDEDCGQV